MLRGVQKFMKLLYIILLSLVCASCATPSQPIEPLRIHLKVNKGTDTMFESIELKEIRKYTIQANSKLRSLGVLYKKNQFDCENYVLNTINEIFVYHKYKYTPYVYQVNILMPDGSVHAILGFLDVTNTERFYDVQGYKEYKDPVVLKRKWL